ncbi:MAG: hypothetical protein N2Z23_09005 [Pyrinomonadaceae bacterium]|nr:hypothetical protein [Pyrinomonadaceae bacterium]MCX7640560.1 hypothetical protein [Pyrinomonadaceae bacterium]MDW8303859.1 hypothetical protein [Acidobacteriota bacterium]
MIRLIKAGFAKLLIIFSFAGILANEQETVILDQLQHTEVILFSKNVVVKSQVKGVLVFGGDVTIEGAVEQDVATIGGSVFQKRGAYIGGDLIVFGGHYVYEDEPPKRGEGKQSIIYAGYEEELKELIRNPNKIFSTSFSWNFIGQRIVSILFWFVFSLFFITLTSEAVSKAISEISLFPWKVFWRGFWGLIFVVSFSVISLAILPGYFGFMLVLMLFLVVILAYVFGRVVIQLLIGKWVQKKLFPSGKRSDSLASLIGVILLTVTYSIPYFWVLAVLFVWTLSLGILITFILDTPKLKNLKP